MLWPIEEGEILCLEFEAILAVIYLFISAYILEESFLSEPLFDFLSLLLDR
jgi:hypothetical protein